MRKFLIKLVSILLLACFAGQDISFAAGGSVSGLLPSIALNFPESVASIEGRFTAPDGDKSVVLIQDAHTNESAQLNIAKAIDAILSAQPMRYVFLEAGTGNDSLSYLRRFAPTEKRQEVARAFLRQGLLQGADYLDLTSDKKFSLWGVENKKLYWEGLRLYRDLKKDREFLNQSMDRLKRAKNTLMPVIWNISLQKLEASRENFLSGDLSSTEYLGILLREAQELKLPLEVFTHLQKLKSLEKKEKSIDFAKAASEESRLIQSLPAEEQKQFVGIVAKAKERISRDSAGIREAYYSLLKEKIKPAAVYPELSKYIDYVLSSGEFNAAETLREKGELEEIVFNRLARTGEEKNLLQAARSAENLRKLLNLELTKEEYSQILKNPEAFSFLNIAGYLNLRLIEGGAHAEDAVMWDDALGADFKKALQFYELTYQRDQAFVENMLRKMDESGEKKSILITGGFHTDHLKDLLRARGISYAVVVPRILQETNREKYEGLLLGQLAQPSSRPAVNSGNENTWALFPAAELKNNGMPIRSFLGKELGRGLAREEKAQAAARLSTITAPANYSFKDLLNEGYTPWIEERTYASGYSTILAHLHGYEPYLAVTQALMMTVYPRENFIFIDRFYPDFPKPQENEARVGRGRAFLRYFLNQKRYAGYEFSSVASDSFQKSLIHPDMSDLKPQTKNHEGMFLENKDEAVARRRSAKGFVSAAKLEESTIFGVIPASYRTKSEQKDKIIFSGEFESFDEFVSALSSARVKEFQSLLDLASLAMIKTRDTPQSQLGSFKIRAQVKYDAAEGIVKVSLEMLKKPGEFREWERMTAVQIMGAPKVESGTPREKIKQDSFSKKTVWRRFLGFVTGARLANVIDAETDAALKSFYPAFEQVPETAVKTEIQSAAENNFPRGPQAARLANSAASQISWAPELERRAQVFRRFGLSSESRILSVGPGNFYHNEVQKISHLSSNSAKPLSWEQTILNQNVFLTIAERGLTSVGYWERIKRSLPTSLGDKVHVIAMRDAQEYRYAAEASQDAAIMLSVLSDPFQDLDARIEILKSVCQTLKPGGPLILGWYSNGTSVENEREWLRTSQVVGEVGRRFGVRFEETDLSGTEPVDFNCSHAWKVYKVYPSAARLAANVIDAETAAGLKSAARNLLMGKSVPISSHTFVEKSAGILLLGTQSRYLPAPVRMEVEPAVFNSFMESAAPAASSADRVVLLFPSYTGYPSAEALTAFSEMQQAWKDPGSAARLILGTLDLQGEVRVFQLHADWEAVLRPASDEVSPILFNQEAFKQIFSNGMTITHLNYPAPSKMTTFVWKKFQSQRWSETLHQIFMARHGVLDADWMLFHLRKYFSSEIARFKKIDLDDPGPASAQMTPAFLQMGIGERKKVKKSFDARATRFNGEMDVMDADFYALVLKGMHYASEFRVLSGLDRLLEPVEVEGLTAPPLLFPREMVQSEKTGSAKKVAPAAADFEVSNKEIQKVAAERTGQVIAQKVITEGERGAYYAFAIEFVGKFWRESKKAPNYPQTRDAWKDKLRQIKNRQEARKRIEEYLWAEVSRQQAQSVLKYVNLGDESQVRVFASGWITEEMVDRQASSDASQRVFPALSEFADAIRQHQAHNTPEALRTKRFDTLQSRYTAADGGNREEAASIFEETEAVLQLDLFKNQRRLLSESKKALLKKIYEKAAQEAERVIEDTLTSGESTPDGENQAHISAVNSARDFLTAHSSQDAADMLLRVSKRMELVFTFTGGKARLRGISGEFTSNTRKEIHGIFMDAQQTARLLTDGAEDVWLAEFNQARRDAANRLTDPVIMALESADGSEPSALERLASLRSILSETGRDFFADYLALLDAAEQAMRARMSQSALTADRLKQRSLVAQLADRETTAKAWATKPMPMAEAAQFFLNDAGFKKVIAGGRVLLEFFESVSKGESISLDRLTKVEKYIDSQGSKLIGLDRYPILAATAMASNLRAARLAAASDQTKLDFAAAISKLEGMGPLLNIAFLMPHYNSRWHREGGLGSTLIDHLFLIMNVLRAMETTDGEWLIKDRELREFVREEIRLHPSDMDAATLLHDIGKPSVAKRHEWGWSFQNHESKGYQLVTDKYASIRFAGQRISDRVMAAIRHHDDHWRKNWDDPQQMQMWAHQLKRDYPEASDLQIGAMIRFVIAFSCMDTLGAEPAVPVSLDSLKKMMLAYKTWDERIKEEEAAAIEKEEIAQINFKPEISPATLEDLQFGALIRQSDRVISYLALVNRRRAPEPTMIRDVLTPDQLNPQQREKFNKAKVGLSAVYRRITDLLNRGDFNGLFTETDFRKMKKTFSVVSVFRPTRLLLPVRPTKKLNWNRTRVSRTMDLTYVSIEELVALAPGEGEGAVKKFHAPFLSVTAMNIAEDYMSRQFDEKWANEEDDEKVYRERKRFENAWDMARAKFDAVPGFKTENNEFYKKELFVRREARTKIREEYLDELKPAIQGLIYRIQESAIRMRWKKSWRGWLLANPVVLYFVKSESYRNRVFWLISRGPHGYLERGVSESREVTDAFRLELKSKIDRLVALMDLGIAAKSSQLDAMHKDNHSLLFMLWLVDSGKLPADYYRNYLRVLVSRSKVSNFILQLLSLSQQMMVYGPDPRQRIEIGLEDMKPIFNYYFDDKTNPKMSLLNWLRPNFRRLRQITSNVKDRETLRKIVQDAETLVRHMRRRIEKAEKEALRESARSESAARLAAKDALLIAAQPHARRMWEGAPVFSPHIEDRPVADLDPNALSKLLLNRLISAVGLRSPPKWSHAWLWIQEHPLKVALSIPSVLSLLFFNPVKGFLYVADFVRDVLSRRHHEMKHLGRLNSLLEGNGNPAYSRHFIRLLSDYLTDEDARVRSVAYRCLLSISEKIPSMKEPLGKYIIQLDAWYNTWSHNEEPWIDLKLSLDAEIFGGVRGTLPVPADYYSLNNPYRLSLAKRSPEISDIETLPVKFKLWVKRASRGRVVPLFTGPEVAYLLRKDRSERQAFLLNVNNSLDDLRAHLQDKGSFTAAEMFAVLDNAIRGWAEREYGFDPDAFFGHARAPLHTDESQGQLFPGVYFFQEKLAWMTSGRPEMVGQVYSLDPLQSDRLMNDVAQYFQTLPILGARLADEISYARRMAGDPPVFVPTGLEPHLGRLDPLLARSLLLRLMEAAKLRKLPRENLGVRWLRMFPVFMISPSAMLTSFVYIAACIYGRKLFEEVNFSDLERPLNCYLPLEVRKGHLRNFVFLAARYLGDPDPRTRAVAYQCLLSISQKFPGFARQLESYQNEANSWYTSWSHDSAPWIDPQLALDSWRESGKLPLFGPMIENRNRIEDYFVRILHDLRDNLHENGPFPVFEMIQYLDEILMGWVKKEYGFDPGTFQMSGNVPVFFYDFSVRAFSFYLFSERVALVDYQQSEPRVISVYVPRRNELSRMIDQFAHYLSHLTVQGARLAQASIVRVDGPIHKNFISPIEYGEKISGTFMPFHHMRHQGDWGIGNFQTAIKMAGVFKRLGLHVMQILPLIWSDAFNSPYSEASSMAIDMRYISVPMFVDAVKDQVRGTLDLSAYDVFMDRNKDLIRELQADDNIQHEKVLGLNREALAILWESLKDSPAFKASGMARRFKQFKQDNADWLPDHMLFMELKEKYNGQKPSNGWDFRSWPKAIRERHPQKIKQLKEQYREKIELASFIQFIADDQFKAFSEAAKKEGVEIAMDIPYARGGADVWMNPKVFGLDKNNGFARPFTHGSLPEENYSIGQYWQFFAYDWSRPETLEYILNLFERYQRRAPYLRIDHALGFYMAYLFMEDGKNQFTLETLGIHEKVLALVADAKRRMTVPRANSAKIKQETAELVSQLFIKTLKNSPVIAANPLIKHLVDRAYPDGEHLSEYAMMFIARQARDSGSFNYETKPEPWVRINDVVEAKVFEKGSVWHYLRLTPHKFALGEGMTHYLFDDKEGPQPGDSLRVAAFDRGPAEKLFSPMLQRAQARGTTVIFETLARFTPEPLKKILQTILDYVCSMWGKTRSKGDNPHDPRIPQSNVFRAYSLHDTEAMRADWEGMSKADQQAALKDLELPEEGNLGTLTPAVQEALFNLSFDSGALMVVPNWLDILKYGTELNINRPGKTGQWIKRLLLSVEDFEAALDEKGAPDAAMEAVHLTQRITKRRKDSSAAALEKKKADLLLRTYPDVDDQKVQILQFKDENNTSIDPFMVEQYVSAAVEEVSIKIRHKNQNGQIEETEIPMTLDDQAPLPEGIARYVVYLEPQEAGAYEYEIKAKGAGKTVTSLKSHLYAAAHQDAMNSVFPDHFASGPMYAPLAMMGARLAAAVLMDEKNILRRKIDRDIQRNGPRIFLWHTRDHRKKFKDISEEDLKQLVGQRRFNILWFQGVWKMGENDLPDESHEEGGSFTRQFNRMWDKNRVGSSYSIWDYELNEYLGTEEEFRALVARANRLGLKVILDVVPNHMSATSRWIWQHPERFIQTTTWWVSAVNVFDYLPDASRFKQLFSDARYFLADTKDHGKVKIAHGGTSPSETPWVDSAQLDWSQPSTRTAMTLIMMKILELTNGGGMRADMSHLTRREHVNGAWGVSMQKEFWPVAIAYLKQTYPGAAMVAECYGAVHGHMQEMGMDFTYDNYMYELLVKHTDPAEEIMRYITENASLGYLRRKIRYLENHDDPPGQRIAQIMSREKRKAARVIMMAAMPGGILINDGEMEGRSMEHPSANWITRDPESETFDPEYQRFNYRLLQQLRDPLFSMGSVRVLGRWKNVVAVIRSHQGRKALVVVNYGNSPAHFNYRPLIDTRTPGWGVPAGQEKEYLWHNLDQDVKLPFSADLDEELQPYQFHIWILEHHHAYLTDLLVDEGFLKIENVLNSTLLDRVPGSKNRAQVLYKALGADFNNIDTENTARHVFVHEAMELNGKPRETASAVFGLAWSHVEHVISKNPEASFEMLAEKIKELAQDTEFQHELAQALKLGPVVLWAGNPKVRMEPSRVVLRFEAALFDKLLEKERIPGLTVFSDVRLNDNPWHLQNERKNNVASLSKPRIIGRDRITRNYIVETSLHFDRLKDRHPDKLELAFTVRDISGLEIPLQDFNHNFVLTPGGARLADSSSSGSDADSPGFDEEVSLAIAALNSSLDSRKVLPDRLISRALRDRLRNLVSGFGQVHIERDAEGDPTNILGKILILTTFLGAGNKFNVQVKALQSLLKRNQEAGARLTEAPDDFDPPSFQDSVYAFWRALNAGDEDTMIHVTADLHAGSHVIGHSVEPINVELVNRLDNFLLHVTGLGRESMRSHTFLNGVPRKIMGLRQRRFQAQTAQNSVWSAIQAFTQNIFQHVLGKFPGSKDAGYIFFLADDSTKLNPDSDVWIYFVDNGPGVSVKDVFLNKIFSGTTNAGMDLWSLAQEKSGLRWICESRGVRWNALRNQLQVSPEKNPARGTLFGIHVKYRDLVTAMEADGNTGTQKISRKSAARLSDAASQQFSAQMIGEIFDEQVRPVLRRMNLDAQADAARKILLRQFMEKSSGQVSPVGFREDSQHIRQYELLVKLFEKIIADKVARQLPVTIQVVELGLGIAPNEMMDIKKAFEEALAHQYIPLNQASLALSAIDKSASVAATATVFVKRWILRAQEDPDRFVPLTVDVTAQDGMDLNGLLELTQNRALNSAKADLIFARNIGSVYLNSAEQYDFSRPENCNADHIARVVTAWLLVRNLLYAFAKKEGTYLILEPRKNLGAISLFTPEPAKIFSYPTLTPITAKSLVDNKTIPWSFIAANSPADVETGIYQMIDEPEKALTSFAEFITYFLVHAARLSHSPKHDTIIAHSEDDFVAEINKWVKVHHAINQIVFPDLAAQLKFNYWTLGPVEVAHEASENFGRVALQHIREAGGVIEFPIEMDLQIYRIHEAEHLTSLFLYRPGEFPIASRLAAGSPEISNRRSEGYLRRVIHRNLPAFRTFVWKLAQWKKDGGEFPLRLNPAENASILKVRMNSEGNAELRVRGTKRPVLTVSRAQYDTLKQQARPATASMSALKDLSSGIDARVNMLLDQLDPVEMDNAKPVVLEIDTAWLDAVSKEYLESFISYLKAEAKKKYMQNVSVRPIGANVSRWLEEPLAAGLFIGDVPDNLSNAQRVKIVPPMETVGENERSLPSHPLVEGDVPSFSFIRLAVCEGRLDDVQNRPEAFDDAYATLAGARPETGILTQILSGKALPSVMLRFALRAIIRVDVNAAIRFLSTMRRMYEQAA